MEKREGVVIAHGGPLFAGERVRHMLERTHGGLAMKTLSQIIQDEQGRGAALGGSSLVVIVLVVLLLIWIL